MNLRQRIEGGPAKAAGKRWRRLPKAVQCGTGGAGKGIVAKAALERLHGKSDAFTCSAFGLDLRKSYRVAAGSAHSVCLTGDGDLFLWGSNKHCQLLSSDPFVPCPRPLRRSLLQEENVGNVWCGWTHVVAQTESGRVFTWGRGDYGQLGRPPPTNQGPTQTSAEGVLPSEVKDLCGATQISCGSEHNLALVGSRLFSWGWNEHGMCGNGSQINVIHPQLISALRRPLLIGCGAGHSLVVCSSKPN